LFAAYDVERPSGDAIIAPCQRNRRKGYINLNSLEAISVHVGVVEVALDGGEVAPSFGGIGRALRRSVDDEVTQNGGGTTPGSLAWTWLGSRVV
jgi:hypothetical protein